MNWPRPFRIAGAPGSPARRRAVALCVAFAIALLSGAVKFGDPFEEAFRSFRGLIEARKASGDIVVVALDDRTINALERWPISRRYYAAAINKLHADGAKRVFLDMSFDLKTDPADDQALARSLAGWKNHVVLATRLIYESDGNVRQSLPIPLFRQNALLGNINFWISFRNSVTKTYYALGPAGSGFPTFSALLANRFGPKGEGFPLDLSTRMDTIPTFSLVDVINNKVPAERFRGKDVIIGADSEQIGDMYFAPGQGLKAGVFFHVIAAETLKRGRPLYLGWLIPFLITSCFAGASLLAKRTKAVGLLVGCTIVLLSLPFLLDAHLIFIDIMPSLLLLVILSCTSGWQEVRRFYRERAATNQISGLANLNALREAGSLCPHPLIAARVLNYAEVVSTLPSEMESILVRQIATRLMLGHPNLKLHQGDEGIFAWLVEDGSDEAIGQHLDTLHTIFRAPVAVGNQLFDLAISFGVDEDYGRPVIARLGSALVAADEAAAEGLKWKLYDPSKLQEATWRLSLLSQLDAAIDGGDLWVAYQPKLDLTSNTIIGAEALVRWTHREKGPISPEEFVRAAEQSNRIEKLTMHVLDRAIESAALINAQGIPFEMAVNISAKLIDDDTLVANVAAILAKHALDSRRLTLEVTETAAMATSKASLETLSRLRTLGLQLAIDDYGTGLSTLEYLRKIPANEIKIDKSFIQAMDNSHGDRLLVRSTIELAHSLGRRIVAEGVEREETLKLLTEMGCDLVQGYFIGKPMTLRALCERLAAERGLRAA